ncbi:hemolysin family protein [Botrimarina sp.]|uniref:hemolysin family protein n=1 Tax=Botrimarina sp. TaxID=2795802 RepID=UPI0032ED1F38
MPLETTLRLLCGVLLVAANGFFVATEFALTRVRQFPKEEFQSHPGLRRAWKMTEELEIYLTGCQVGITFTSLLLGIIVEPAVTELMEPLVMLFGVSETAAHGVGLTVGLVLINLVHTIWAEQAPTYLGIEKSKMIAKYCAIPHLWWTRICYPLLIVGDGVAKWTLRLFGIEMNRSWTEAEAGEKPPTQPQSRADLIRTMGQALEGAGLPDDRRDEVLRTLHIGEIAVRQAAVPRERIVALRADESFSESIEKIGLSKHTRYPLVGDSLEDFRGVVYLPELFAYLDDLIRGDKRLADIAAAPMEVSADLPIAELVDRFQEKSHELALVRDGDRVVGLITLTDAVEKIVGEAEDPLDARADDSVGL